MNDDMGFDEKLKELYGALYDALSGMADKVNGALNSKGFQINARRVLAGRLREAAERPDLSWPVLCDVLCVSGRKEAVRALAAMVDPKYAPTEEERRILDMWPRFEDTGEPVMVGDKALSNKDEMFKVYRIQFTDGIWMLNDNPVLGHYKNGDCETRVKRPAPEVLDADGVRIREGDTVWIIPALTDTPDEPHEVIGINRWGEVLLEFHTEGSTGLKGEYLTHTRPDSWERLEEDAVKGVCEYTGAEPTAFGAHDCDTCRFYGEHGKLICEQLMALDILRRAKKLAGVER